MEAKKDSTAKQIDPELIVEAFNKLQEACGESFPQYVFEVVAQLAIYKDFYEKVDQAVFFKSGKKVSTTKMLLRLQHQVKQLQQDLNINTIK